MADEVNVVGHDIGAMVAYAYAAAHRGTTRRLARLKAPQIDEMLYQLPSITPQGPGLWNFEFFTLENGLPERIVVGRERRHRRRAARGHWTPEEIPDILLTEQLLAFLR